MGDTDEPLWVQLGDSAVYPKATRKERKARKWQDSATAGKVYRVSELTEAEFIKHGQPNLVE